MFREVILELASRGNTSFSFKDVRKLKRSTPSAIKAALYRLQKKGELAMPYKGFYVIVPPEHRADKCIPPEQFIPDLMKYLGVKYYVSLLSAAEYYGAGHHRPQVFQVVVPKMRRPIKCGKVRVEFFVRKNAEKIPTQNRNTYAGILKVATPEATAFDLIGYVKKCAGLDNVVTVIAELSEKIDADKLADIAGLSPVVWAQRVGYLLDVAGWEHKSGGLAEYIKRKKPVRSPLMPGVGVKGSKYDKKWRLFVNINVEPEV